MFWFVSKASSIRYMYISIQLYIILCMTIVCQWSNFLARRRRFFTSCTCITLQTDHACGILPKGLHQLSLGQVWQLVQHLMKIDADSDTLNCTVPFSHGHKFNVCVAHNVQCSLKWESVQWDKMTCCSRLDCMVWMNDSSQVIQAEEAWCTPDRSNYCIHQNYVA